MMFYSTASALLLTLATAVNAEWSCANDGDGPSADQMAAIKVAFDNAHGTAALNLGGQFETNGGDYGYAVTCDGVTFGIIDVLAYSYSEPSGARDEATSVGTGGGGACVWTLSDSTSYEAGFEGDITWCSALGCPGMNHVEC